MTTVDAEEIEKAIKIAQQLSNHGGLPCEMTPKQLNNWLKFLLEEKPATHYKKGSGTIYKNGFVSMQMQIIKLSNEGLSDVCIALETGCSRTMVKNFMIDLRYNKLLERAQKVGIKESMVSGAVWKYGNNIGCE